MATNTTLTFWLSFRIWHPSIPLEELSSRLASTPEFGWSAGDAKLSPRGRPLGGVRTETYWCKAVKRRLASFSPDEVIADHLASLAPLEAFFERLVRTGGKIEYFLTCSSEGAVGVAFDPSLLNALGRLHIRLDIDGFGSTASEQMDGQGPTTRKKGMVRGRAR